MIKPFLILDTKESSEGTTVFFRVKKTVILSGTKYSTQMMESAILVPVGEDLELYLFNNLQKMGWI